MTKDISDIMAFCERLTDSEADMLIALARSLERAQGTPEPYSAQAQTEAAHKGRGGGVWQISRAFTLANQGQHTRNIFPE